MKAKAKKKLGRPLRGEAASTAPVKVRLTPRESAALRKAAKAAGLTLSAFIREGALRHVKEGR